MIRIQLETIKIYDVILKSKDRDGKLITYYYPEVEILEDDSNYYQFHRESGFYRKAHKNINPLYVSTFGDWHQADEHGLAEMLYSAR